MSRFVGLNPGLRASADGALKLAADQGLKITVTSVFRTEQEQAYLRRRWEMGESKWPANRPGESAHNFGLAWDSVPNDMLLMPLWVELRRALGWRVPENDTPHAELPDWKSWVTLPKKK